MRLMNVLIASSRPRRGSHASNPRKAERSVLGLRDTFQETTMEDISL